MVNRGEEKVRVHMNVVLRGTTFICTLTFSFPALSAEYTPFTSAVVLTGTVEYCIITGCDIQ